MDARAGARTGALNDRGARRHSNCIDAALLATASHPRSVRRDGVVCRVDRYGREHFNFRQFVWLYPAVGMQTAPRYTREVEVLAANLLTLVVPRPERTQRVYLGQTSRAVITLAPDFAKECLLCVPAHGWRIPLEMLATWLHGHSKRRNRF